MFKFLKKWWFWVITVIVISDLEKEPAYKRRDIRFDDVAHSSEEPKSKFTISETEDNGEKRFGLRENNSFLHDNVD